MKKKELTQIEALAYFGEALLRLSNVYSISEKHKHSNKPDHVKFKQEIDNAIYGELKISDVSKKTSSRK